ncbi:hypothetical protein GGF42_006786 [Coemansia sp. RSA 2424]|nr:hypothetical protein GGF42_006786 [Coemansia sp. RSA 2424]
MIVDHVAGNSRLYFARATHWPYEYDGLLLPLIWVCRNFRFFVHARFCKHYKLTLSAKRKLELSSHRCSWPYRRRDLGYPTHHLAKELDVYLDITTVLSGQALQLLLDSLYAGCALPLVRKVSFELDHVKYELSSYGNADDHARGNDHSFELVSVEANVLEPTTNITAFVQQIKRMLPSVREVKVVPGLEAENDFGHSSTERDLALQLFGIVETRTMITRGCYLFVKYADLEPIRDLVHIECDIVGLDQATILLTRRSAQTLQLLQIRFKCDTDIAGLIRDANGSSYLEYPCLHKLKLSSYDSISPSMSSVFSGAVPFPSLRHLSISCDYPFADDMLFRGNSATLESLEVTPHPATVAMLTSCNLFTPTSHPKLQRVNIGALPFLVPGPFPDIGTYLRFVLRIAPGASV